MWTAEDCLERAEALERLAEQAVEAFRREAYLQMAAYWRAAAQLKERRIIRDEAPQDAIALKHVGDDDRLVLTHQVSRLRLRLRHVGRRQHLHMGH